MRRGGGKKKGGAFEHIVARQIAKAFQPFGIHPDDCYRTKNSGATKAQPGDLQFSSAFTQMFPALIECKHYRSVDYKLGRMLDAQPKSYEIKSWWEQVEREQRDAELKKFGLLVFRENNCPDMVAFDAAMFRRVSRLPFSRIDFRALLVTYYGGREVWMTSFDEFLHNYTLQWKWVFGRNDATLWRDNANQQEVQYRNGTPSTTSSGQVP